MTNINISTMYNLEISGKATVLIGQESSCVPDDNLQRTVEAHHIVSSLQSKISKF